MIPDNNTKKSDFNVHFLGIGGISNSALALYLKAKGFNVSGSDKSRSETTNMLEEHGITISDDLELLSKSQLIVRSSAISDEDRGCVLAKKLKIPVITRAELLKQIADNFEVTVGVAGTHGKTTATSMLAHIFYEANKKFTAHIGGMDSDFGNLLMDGNEYFITEICEYKKNIELFSPSVAVLLNVDNDHLDSYKNFAELAESMMSFGKRSGIFIANYDDALLSKVGQCVHYSLFEPKCDYFACGISKCRGGLKFKVYERGKKLGWFKVHSYHKHNVSNALAAIAAARQFGISARQVRLGIENFKGVKRRDELIYGQNGMKIIADYAHHPAQIEKSIDCAAANCKGRLYVMFQPHTYSRTRLLFGQFVAALSKASNLIIVDTYGAREKFEYMGSAQRLCEALPRSQFINANVDCICDVLSNLKSGDVLLVLGAGDIYGLTKEAIALKFTQSE